VYRSQRPRRRRRTGQETARRSGKKHTLILSNFHLKRFNAKVPVWAVLDYTDTKIISRELLLVKVSILGPEYLEEQLAGGPTLQPRRPDDTPTDTKLQQETVLAQNFERSALANDTAFATPITPSQALRLKHQHLQSISVLASQFSAKIVDVSEHSVIVELTAKTTRVEAFLNLLKPFGILEAARTGLMAMPRTPFKTDEDEVETSDEALVDASSLPPG
jgi:acetolactate synthase-1/3 small subunit